MINTSRSPGSVVPVLTGKHVFAFLLLFFGVVFSVNFYFMFSALSTHTGVVSIEPYRKGLAYNSRIAADEAQQARGWHDVLKVDSSGAVSLTITNKANVTVADLTVNAVIGRPATVQFDRALVLKPQSDGSYATSAGALENGAWLVTIEALSSKDDVEPVYRARRRLWLKP